jgi:drug/metabolite transporter (DMT)-like permease
MKKLLKTLVVIGLIVFIYNLQMEIFTFRQIPFLESNLYPIYAICLLPCFGYYLANYSKYRQTGIIIAILSVGPVLFFFIFVIMNVIAFILGDTPEPIPID